MKSENSLIKNLHDAYNKFCGLSRNCIILVQQKQTAQAVIIGPPNMEKALYQCIKSQPELIELFENVSRRIMDDKLDAILDKRRREIKRENSAVE